MSEAHDVTGRLRRLQGESQAVILLVLLPHASLVRGFGCGAGSCRWVKTGLLALTEDDYLQILRAQSRVPANPETPA